MKTPTLVVQPRLGFGELKFGQSIEETVKFLGESQEIDQIEDEELFNTIIMHYWDIGTSIFFEGIDKPVLSCFETDNQDALLFGEKVFHLSEDSIVNLMKTNGYKSIEIEVEEGEKRVSFEDGLIDFFFVSNKLIAVNWGVFVNNEGEIEEI